MTRLGACLIALLALITVGVAMQGTRATDSDAHHVDYSVSGHMGGPAVERSKGLTPRAGTIECPDVPIGIYATAMGTFNWSASFISVENTDCGTATRLVRAWWFHVPGRNDSDVPAGWACEVADYCAKDTARVYWGRKYARVSAAVPTL